MIREVPRGQRGDGPRGTRRRRTAFATRQVSKRSVVGPAWQRLHKSWPTRQLPYAGRVAEAEQKLAHAAACHILDAWQDAKCSARSHAAEAAAKTAELAALADQALLHLVWLCRALPSLLLGHEVQGDLLAKAYSWATKFRAISC